MIKTKEELFLAELGINPKEEIELSYGASIKISDLLKKYEAKQLSINSVMQAKPEKVCDVCGDKIGYEYIGKRCYLPQDKCPKNL